jgi:hypothetical protein
MNIDSSSEQFRAINQLVAWIFAGGGLTRDTFVPVCSVDDQLTLATLYQLLKWLNIAYRIRDAEASEHSLEVIPREGASVLGRVLHVLGAPRGVKTKQKSLALPSYLRTVEETHQRDFARIYLLNRDRDMGESGTAGSDLYAISSSSFARELQTFLTSITAGSVTLGKHNQLWVSAESVRDLAKGEPLRPAIATKAAFGALTPPTERAFASTYRQDETPSGYRRIQLYDQVRESDQSRRELTQQHPELAETTIQSWRRGHKPYAKNALIDAREQGWLTPPTDGDTALGLTTLLAWVTAQGSLRSKTYYPTFLVTSTDEQDRLEAVAKDIGVSLHSVREDSQGRRPVEMRPSEHGAILGRVLYTLGAPLADGEHVLPPAHLYYRLLHAEQFVLTWCQLAGDQEGKTFIVTIPSRLGGQFVYGFECLVDEFLEWPIERNSSYRLRVTPQYTTNCDE